MKEYIFESTTQALEVFDEMREKAVSIAHAMSVIYLDSVTCAPSNTAAYRARTLGTMSALEYDITTAPEVKAAIAYLSAHLDELDEMRSREITQYDRENKFVSSIPKEEYSAYSELIANAEAVWHKAKQENDFSAFEPYLEQIFECNRRFAGYFCPEKPAYDVLLDRYERGLTMEKADEFFASLRAEIVPLLAKVMSAPQVDDSFLSAHYPVEKQRELSDYLMEVMGMDRSHCGIAETEHPFTINFGCDDVRITTHYHEDNVASSMYSVIHEGGHALYELGVGKQYERTFLSGGISMGIHESQSRLFENLIGRSREFIALIFPKLLELFPEQLAGVDAEMFYKAVNKVEPSLIRTEADELTYALHVMVRYELEKAIIGGELKVKDLPAAWNAKYKEYLGIDVPDDTRGVLQDSHWSGGSVGYFPSYALGSAYGAQMMESLRKDVDVSAAIAGGSLKPIVDWLGERIYQHGCMYDPAWLIDNCCKAEFDPAFFVRYLTEKFSDIYNLK